ncbi:MAG: SUMF1/EgtB/PvdO family nonheme iron enzyme [Mariprofundaceae bacterium]|nr:SUMF1/EgtB/PvdO family nonheme iron enzyme [Mariprofundaceae bacterium]
MKNFLLLFLYILLSHTAYANTWLDIPAGDLLMGSTAEQIEEGYRISQQGYGHDGVRKARWFDGEAPQVTAHTNAFRIMQTPVTQAEYAVFIKETKHRAPFVSPKQWQSYHLAHPYTHVRAYLWLNKKPPQNKSNHPVVLVSIEDAQAYAHWLSQKTGQNLKLPSEKQWEKAMRGDKGYLYPWGNTYRSDYLNNADQTPDGTMPVGLFPQAASPYGVLDGAGQVFEWTRNIHNQKATVKGGSWDDHGGVCRPAAHHQRPVTLKHILIGFRLLNMGKL